MRAYHLSSNLNGIGEKSKIMQWYQIATIIISALSLLGLGTVMSTFWKEKHDKRKEISEENQKILKQLRQDELREVIKSEIDPIKEKLEIIVGGTQATLRNDLLNCYYACKKKKYRTEDDTKNFMDMHDAYHKLGGNSFIDKDVAPAFYELKGDWEVSIHKKPKKTTKRKILTENKD